MTATIDWPIKTTYVRKGRRLAFAYVDGGDGDVITGKKYFQIPFEITGKSGAWQVTSELLGWKYYMNAHTLPEALETIRSLTEMIHEYLTDWDIWRNSGGFVCVGGWYKGWYVYMAKAPYEKVWNLQAREKTTGRKVTERSGEPLSMVYLIQHEVDWRIKKAAVEYV